MKSTVSKKNIAWLRKRYFYFSKTYVKKNGKMTSLLESSGVIGVPGGP